MRFEGRNVLVTGAAAGIGLAIAEAFLAEGATVGAADRDVEGLQALAGRHGESGRLATLEADLADLDAATGLGARAEERIGPLDVLVNNAGLMEQRPILEIEPADWERLFAVNLRAVFFLTQAVARGMADRGTGAVVSITSVNAIRTEAPEAHYNATKAGIVALMRSFATELGHRGVRFNCVAPGETVGPALAAELGANERATIRRYLERVPMRRVGTAAEQAKVALFLASEDASYVNGETIVADGGEMAGDWYDTERRPPLPETLDGIDGIGAG